MFFYFESPTYIFLSRHTLVTGRVVVMQSPFEGAEEAVAILSKGVEPLKSQFTVDYGMALGLLQSYSISEAKSLVEKSFGNYLGTKVVRGGWVAFIFFLEKGVLGFI